MARRIILSPQRIDGWLDAIVAKAIQAHEKGLECEIGGRVEGVLMLDKDGKLNLVSRLAADSDALGALMGGGAPIPVEGSVEVGWESETKVGRLAWGHCAARFWTKGAPVSREEV